MALVRCSECDNEISDKAAACPRCGSPTVSPQPAAANPPLKPQQPKAAKRGDFGTAFVVGLVVVVGFVFVAYKCSQSTSEKEAAAAVSKEENDRFFKYVGDRVDARSWVFSEWTLEEYTRQNVRISLEYARPPAFGVPMDESAAVGRIVLDYIVKNLKRRPAQENLGVWIWARRHFKGSTGEGMVEVYGSSDYNPNKDRMEWSPKSE